MAYSTGKFKGLILEPEAYQEFKANCAYENTNMSKKMRELILKYNQECYDKKIKETYAKEGKVIQID